MRKLGLAVVLGVSCLTGCQTYVGRLVWLQGIDVEDHRHLPTRAVAASPQARDDAAPLDRNWIAAAPFAAAGGRIEDQADLDAFLASHGTTAFLILEDGHLVDERYYHGHRRDALFKSFSMSKSVLSALVGIAEAEGVLSLGDAVGDYVPLANTPAVAAITLEQLADNTSGFRYRRGNAPWKEQPRMYYTTDVRAMLRDLAVERTPGATFEAEELSPLLLGYALEQALRRRDPAMTLARYTEERLWRPMGARHDAAWVIDHADDGLEKTESGFVARAIDLARFGQLYLDLGHVDGREVVPQAWVLASLTPPPPGSPSRLPDGFHRRLWWGADRGDGAEPDIYANGHFGQRILLDRSKRLVLVRLGKDGGGINWTAVLSRIARAWPERSHAPATTSTADTAATP